MRRDPKAVAGTIELALGRTVKYFRAKKGIGQEALAHISGINRTYMTDIELGRRSVGIGVITKIINGLDVDMYTFMNALSECYYVILAKDITNKEIS